MLFFMFVRSLFQFGSKVGKREGYYGEKNDIDMSFHTLRTFESITFIVIDLSVFHSLFHLQPLLKFQNKLIGYRINLRIMADQHYKGFDRKMSNFHDLTSFPT